MHRAFSQSQYYLPGTQFESSEDGIQSKADEYAEKLIVLARRQLTADPAAGLPAAPRSSLLSDATTWQTRIVQGKSEGPPIETRQQFASTAELETS